MIETDVRAAVSFLQTKTNLKPKLGFVLGSGLSGVAEMLTVDCEVPFSEIPHFAVSTVAGHPGRIIFGKVGGLPTVVLQGRLHAYEGLDFSQVVFPVRVLGALGIKAAVITNAAGGLKKTMRPGDFMIIDDQINLTGHNPLRGLNWERGPRFVDMTAPYDPKLSKTLKSVLTTLKVRHTRGVYVGVLGPSYETAAEIRFFAKIGGGAVGMSTVAEVIAARHMGLRVVGLSCITNLGTGLSRVKLSHDDVKDVAAKVEGKLKEALVRFTAKISAEL